MRHVHNSESMHVVTGQTFGAAPGCLYEYRRAVRVQMWYCLFPAPGSRLGIDIGLGISAGRRSTLVL